VDQTYPIPVALQPHCTGPADAWLLPRLRMRFRALNASIHTPVAKLGGQPTWLDSPTWPMSRTTTAPMKFVGQFPVPGDPLRLAYLFITEDGALGETFPETYSPDAGENALLVQPGGRIPPWVTVTDVAIGPSLWRRGITWNDRVPVELAVDLARLDPATEAVLDAEIASLVALLDPPGLDEVAIDEIPTYSYVGGKVHLWHPEHIAVDTDWRFFFQLDGGDGWRAGDPYALNFGGGTGYGFLSQDRREGRFFWDRA
jgi:hypothetical protein